MELPHRHPIALIDRHEIIDDQSIVASYTVQADHPVLEGHFPHVKIWPGVYLIEGMNQCAGIHALHLAEQEVGKAHRDGAPGERHQCQVRGAGDRTDTGLGFRKKHPLSGIRGKGLLILEERICF